MGSALLVSDFNNFSMGISDLFLRQIGPDGYTIQSWHTFLAPRWSLPEGRSPWLKMQEKLR